MNKFEQLIEYVINDEEQKARELFHDIVVEKSRTIYEEMMNDEELDEAADDAGEDEELDEAKDEDLEENMLGGDQADDLIDDIEVEEEGMTYEGEEGDEGGMADEEGAENLEDRVVDLEDKLDELMAEFESLLGDEAGEMHGDEEVDGEELADVSADDFGDDSDSEEEMVDTEFETENMFAENVSLKSAPAPVKSEDGGINKKAVYAANSGARGAMAKPVHAGANEGGHHDSAAYKNTTKDLIGKVGNTPAQSTQKLTPATKPQLGQAAGVNTKPVIR
jgi:hypothetical protein